MRLCAFENAGRSRGLLRSLTQMPSVPERLLLRSSAIKCKYAISTVASPDRDSARLQPPGGEE